MDEAGEITARLAAIRRAYIAELPRKIVDLNQIWSAAQESAWQSVQSKELHRLVHNLAGSGATFGFPIVSESARALETGLSTLLNPEVTDDIDAIRGQLPRLFEALIAALRSAADMQ